MSEESQVRYLFRQHVDGALTPTEFANLEQQLATDAALRAEFVRFIDLEANLHDEFSHRAEMIPVASPVRHFWPWVVGAMMATAACVTLALNLSQRPVEVVEQAPTPIPQAPAYYVPAPLQGLPDVAVVTLTEGISQLDLREQLQVGTRLKSGIIKLTQGELQLDFLGGARVLLQAPAELHMVSNSAGTLVSGAVGVRMSHAQKSFVLNAPDVAVIDINLSTEFAVSVNADRHSQVHVYAGEVEISLLGDDGNTLFSQRLVESSTVAVDPQARQFAALAAPTSLLPRVREAERNDLNITTEYVQQVERSQPYLYWRFESMEDGIVRDLSGNGFDAEVVAGTEDAQAIRTVDGVLEFVSSAGPRSLVTKKPVPNFNSGDLSIELWVMPAEFSQAVVMGALLPGDGPIPMHLNLIELAHNTALVHQPGVIRFLHRQPARQLGGYNLFSQNICIPGTWTHVVATKTLEELNLYVNGQLLRTVSGPGTGAGDDLSYHIMLGQLSPISKTRQFNGWIDEVAVYRRVLSATEVSRHYWSTITPKPGAAARIQQQSPNIVASRTRIPLKQH